MEVNSKQIIHNLLNLKQLVFEVTDSCNLNCKYCGYSDFYVGYQEIDGEKLILLKNIGEIISEYERILVILHL